MRSFFTACCFILAVSTVHAQGGTWIWMMGDSSLQGNSGVYGTQGVPSAANIPPNLYESATWVDQQGNFWLMGGRDTLSITMSSDLWMFNPISKQWTWVKGPGEYSQRGVYGVQGVPSVNNYPGARAYGVASWTDADGYLWLYGGYAYDSVGLSPAVMNDLWKYNITTNEWTWMGGSANNTPGVGPALGTFQQPSSTAQPGETDEQTATWLGGNNNLWFFNGNRLTMWRFDVGLNEWARMWGPDSVSRFGTKGVEAPANSPGYRWAYTNWKDAAGNFYVWGGGGENSLLQTVGASDDVWKYSPVTNFWTWVAGDSGTSEAGHYNTLCVDTITNTPHARLESKTPAAPPSQCGNVLYGFGGLGPQGPAFFEEHTAYALNDLWIFNPITYTWKWITGSADTTPYHYGTKSVASPANYPPGRSGESIWLDTNNNLWIFGGTYGGSLAGAWQRNDMWEFIPDAACVGIAAVSDSLHYSVNKTTVCKGDSVLLNLTSPGINISPSAGITWQDSTHAILRPDRTTNYILTGVTACGTGDTATQKIQVINATVNITSANSIICPGDTTQICAPPGFSSYSWNTGQSTSCITATAAGNYYITITENNSCTAESNHISVSTYPISPVAINVRGDTLKAFNALSYQWLLNGNAIHGATDSIYIASTSGTYSLQITDANGCIENSNPIIITGINNQTAENNITVFPNPTSSGWQLNVSGDWIGSRAEVFDATGRGVFKSVINNAHSIIEIAGLAGGVYELRISSGAHITTRKLVRE